MRKPLCLLLFLYFWLYFVKCDKSDNSVVVGMKNDLTKSVKKNLENYMPHNSTNLADVSSKNSSAIVTTAGNNTVNNSSNINNVSKNSIVLSEGGGFINLTSVNHPSGNVSTSPPSVSSPIPHHSLSSTVNHTSNPIVFEGGGSIHLTGVGSSSTQPKVVTDKIPTSTSNPPPKKVNEERKISARKGVVFEITPNISETSSTTTTSTTKVKVSSTTLSYSTESTTRRHKPKFAMIIGDHETKERQSFIESPTTGKDYIFPIVLTIMALPLIFLIIKLIYKRGSEYTERRHYDRMYLIDGMYNTR